MAHLRVFSPDGPQSVERAFPLERNEVVIGRDPGCDLVLQGIGASRRHAFIQRTATGWMLVDQGSANGTLVQGQRVSSQGLRNGDTIQMGDSRLVFVEGPQASGEARCTRCSAPVAPGTRFCPGCGAPLGGAAPPPSKKRGGCLWFAGCGCLLVVALVAGLAAFILWRAGGIDGLTRRSIHTPRIQPR
jgi:hypothetical protein